MRPLRWVSAMLLLASTTAMAAEPMINFPKPHHKSGPGLHCYRLNRGTTPIFAAPSWKAEAFGYYRLPWVAANGPIKDGFLPTITSIGRQGWIPAQFAGQPDKECIVYRNKAGELKFEYF